MHHSFYDVRVSERSSQPDDYVSLGIVDNDPFALQAMDALIRRQRPPIDIVWTCLSGTEALEFCSTIACPRVVLTDVWLEGMDGFELSRRIGLRFPGVGVVGVTAFAVPEGDAMPDGSRMDSVLSKDAPIEEIIRAVGAAGGSPALSQWTSGDQLSPLSRMELRVVRMVSRGFTYAAIGHQLHISEQTVKTYMRRIFEKLDVRTRSECIAYCALQGWLA